MATHALVRRFPWDALERIAWTALEGTVGLAVAAIADVGAWWALPIAVGLAALKALIAKQIGQPGTASTLPASKDPAAVAAAYELGVLRHPPAS